MAAEKRLHQETVLCNDPHSLENGMWGATLSFKVEGCVMISRFGSYRVTPISLKFADPSPPSKDSSGDAPRRRSCLLSHAEFDPLDVDAALGRAALRAWTVRGFVFVDISLPESMDFQLFGFGPF